MGGKEPWKVWDECAAGCWISVGTELPLLHRVVFFLRCAARCLSEVLHTAKLAGIEIGTHGNRLPHRTRRT
jgi:hypothetical protein